MEMNEMNYETPQEDYSEVETPVEPEKKSAGLSVTSMIFGIASLVLSCCVPYLPIFTSIATIIISIIAFAKKSGKIGMAIAGLICAVIGFVMAIFVSIVGTAVLAELGSGAYSY